MQIKMIVAEVIVEAVEEMKVAVPRKINEEILNLAWHHGAPFCRDRRAEEDANRNHYPSLLHLQVQPARDH